MCAIPIEFYMAIDALDRFHGAVAQYRTWPSVHRNAKLTEYRAARLGGYLALPVHTPDPRRFDAPVPFHRIPTRPVRRVVAHSSGGKPG